MTQPKNLPYPFMRPEFLQALENSKSASEQSGWQPIHLSLVDGEQTGFMPLYLKEHSMGEYVFDHAWANAYHENGLEYFPKLLTAIPFTPSTGPRIRGIELLEQNHCNQLFEEVLSVADETDASSWHLLFPQARELELFNDPRLLQRSGVQYHWHNRDFQSFDDFSWHHEFPQTQNGTQRARRNCTPEYRRRGVGGRGYYRRDLGPVLSAL